jgi:hypothetical protein
MVFHAAASGSCDTNHPRQIEKLGNSPVSPKIHRNCPSRTMAPQWMCSFGQHWGFLTLLHACYAIPSPVERLRGSVYNCADLYDVSCAGYLTRLPGFLVSKLPVSLTGLILLLGQSHASSKYHRSRRSWVQLWLLRARPMAARASAVSGMRAVYDEEGTDPGECPACHIPLSHKIRAISTAITTPGSKRWPPRAGAPVPP